MVTMITYDKENLTAEMLNDALKPHGLFAKKIENGDAYEFAICSSGTTDAQIADEWIRQAGYVELPDGTLDLVEDQTMDELRRDIMDSIR